MTSQSQRIEAVVTYIADNEFYLHALDDVGQSYFIPARNIETLGAHRFSDLRPGSKVSLIPIEGPKGLRGIEVRILQP